jgi:trk system potassium uptake protein
MNLTMNLKKGLKPAQILVLSFMSIILIGTIFLMLPVSTVSGEMPTFINAFFTSTSAVCVTGLVVVDTGTYWSTFGKTIILILIQVGGLGFMTMTTTVAILLGKKIGLRNRIIMQEALNQFSISGVIRLTKYVFISTMIIEGVGALFLSFRFVPEMGLATGIYYSVFHSVSAFCNAGFDIMGNGKSLMAYGQDPFVSIVVMVLIIIGGLGFAVVADLFRTQKFSKLTLHSKLVLTMTGILISSAFVLVFLFEFNNPSTIGTFSFGDKIVASMFQAITPRTAGFNSIPTDMLTLPTKLLTIMLMFVGGSPGSTAGGIKTTTFGMMFLTIIAVAKGREDIQFSNRRIPKAIINRALTVIFGSTFVIGILMMLLFIVEPGHSFEDLVFETFSAFGTVGLSLGITPYLTTAGKSGHYHSYVFW